MASNITSGTPLRPLNPGNVISSGVQLYRNNPGLYLPSAVVAYLWIFVPVYGWAKFAMISAMMSRLAFQQLIDEPETVGQTRAKLRTRLWSFLGVAFSVGLRIFGVYIGGALVLGIVIGVMAAIAPPLAIIAGIILGLGFIFVLIWFVSRWIVAEVPLAVESGLTGGQSVDRSWNLTEKCVGRIQIVAFIGFLVTLPITALTGYLPDILLTVFAPDIGANPLIRFFIFILSLAGGVVLMPFWQIIKAVLYYDLRSRQEGLDLELRD